MKRRNFLAGLGPLAVAPLLSNASESSTLAEGGQYLEWIKYTLPTGSNKNRVEKYYEGAAVQALNDLGISNIGVFNVMYGPNEPSLYVLIPHDSIESLMTYQERLLANSNYMKAANGKKN